MASRLLRESGWLVVGWVVVVCECACASECACVCVPLCECVCVSLCVCEVLWKPCVRQALSTQLTLVSDPISCGGSAGESGSLGLEALESLARWESGQKGCRW